MNPVTSFPYSLLSRAPFISSCSSSQTQEISVQGPGDRNRRSRIKDMLIDYLPKKWRPDPRIECRSMFLLNIACLFIILRTVLDIKDLRQQLTRYKITVASTKLENKELKKLKMTNMLLPEKDRTLKQKLAQQQLRFRERETKLQMEIETFEIRIMEMTTERQKNEDCYKTQITELEERFSDLENSLSSSKYENEMLKESCKAHTEQSVRMEEENYELQANFEVEKRMLEADVEILEKKLKMTNMLLPEKDRTLKRKAMQKLTQQQLRFRERETKLQMEIETSEIRIMEMITERQKNEDCYKTQEYLKACSRKSTDSAEEMFGLQKSLEQQHHIQQDEILSLKRQLERMANEMQERESTLKKELAQKDATTVETKEQFVQYREEILKVAKERQHFLKAEVAYRESERALARERNNTADLHRKLEELNNKLVVYSGESQMAPETSGIPF
ncbi:hypothetical protein SKAU_G00047260 [Synaphobranchus kaupii]|uniref:Uncharacterized protein n=1 Tax=Synaphobranchus kaupii TaxID=118154 RepID=A0A9Q1J8A9_SYNKA|nr:hypothetical protein SKAU_G00047260 [Synaphobranchus kaupii]